MRIATLDQVLDAGDDGILILYLTADDCVGGKFLDAVGESNLGPSGLCSICMSLLE